MASTRSKENIAPVLKGKSKIPRPGGDKQKVGFKNKPPARVISSKPTRASAPVRSSDKTPNRRLAGGDRAAAQPTCQDAPSIAVNGGIRSPCTPRRVLRELPWEERKTVRAQRRAVNDGNSILNQEGFKFEKDDAALQSILDNSGVREPVKHSDRHTLATCAGTPGRVPRISMYSDMSETSKDHFRNFTEKYLRRISTIEPSAKRLRQADNTSGPATPKTPPVFKMPTGATPRSSRKLALIAARTPSPLHPKPPGRVATATRVASPKGKKHLTWAETLERSCSQKGQEAAGWPESKKTLHYEADDTDDKVVGGGRDQDVKVASALLPALAGESSARQQGCGGSSAGGCGSSGGLPYDVTTSTVELENESSQVVSHQVPLSEQSHTQQNSAAALLRQTAEVSWRCGEPCPTPVSAPSTASTGPYTVASAKGEKQTTSRVNFCLHTGVQTEHGCHGNTGQEEPRPQATEAEGPRTARQVPVTVPHHAMQKSFIQETRNTSTTPSTHLPPASQTTTPAPSPLPFVTATTRSAGLDMQLPLDSHPTHSQQQSSQAADPETTHQVLPEGSSTEATQRTVATCGAQPSASHKGLATNIVYDSQQQAMTQFTLQQQAEQASAEASQKLENKNLALQLLLFQEKQKELLQLEQQIQAQLHSQEALVQGHGDLGDAEVARTVHTQPTAAHLTTPQKSGNDSSLTNRTHNVMTDSVSSGAPIHICSDDDANGNIVQWSTFASPHRQHQVPSQQLGFFASASSQAPDSTTSVPAQTTDLNHNFNSGTVPLTKTVNAGTKSSSWQGEVIRDLCQTVSSLQTPQTSVFAMPSTLSRSEVSGGSQCERTPVILREGQRTRLLRGASRDTGKRNRTEEELPWNQDTHTEDISSSSLAEDVVHGARETGFLHFPTPLAAEKVVRRDQTAAAAGIEKISVPIMTPMALKVVARQQTGRDSVDPKSDELCQSLPNVRGKDTENLQEYAVLERLVLSRSTWEAAEDSKDDIITTKDDGQDYKVHRETCVVSETKSSGDSERLERPLSVHAPKTPPSKSSAFRVVRSSTSLTPSIGSLSLAGNSSGSGSAGRSVRRRPSPEGALHRQVLQASNERYQEALLEEEVALYACRLVEQQLLSLNRGCCNPVAKILMEGDEMHFVPIDDNGNSKDLESRQLECSAFMKYDSRPSSPKLGQGQGHSHEWLLREQQCGYREDKD